LETVQLFVTCLVDTLYPETGLAVVEVLERAGVRVEFPADQTCCGQPAFNAGLRSKAQAMAQQTIRVFEKTSGPVIVPSGSCAAMIRHHYLELFEEDSEWYERARGLAERVFEFSEFLVDQLQVVDLGACFPEPVTYHPSCHLLREMRIDRQPRLLLEAVKQADQPDLHLEVRPLPNADECCGFGGVFSVEHPEISAAMMERKIGNIEATGARVVVSCDAGCITHLNGGLQRIKSSMRAVHIAEILRKYLDKPG
jgi:L-lactate dehydrogenase complex protein LldE